MGDVGYLDSAGRIWFCGRKSHRVVTPGRVFFTIPCEGIFNTHPKVFRSALVGMDQGGVRAPAICVELEQAAKNTDVGVLITELRKMALSFEHTAPIERFLIHPGFPVDIRHNAKIFREKLAVWAARQAG
jgi:acyl-coenzyme A synthetase/AMP-(fatty) acid ligase